MRVSIEPTRAARDFTSSAGRWGLLCVMVPFVAIVATHLDAIPIWDGMNYQGCVEDAVGRPFDLLNFRCFDHPSIVYLLLWGVTQYVRPWTPSLMYGVNAVAGLASIAALNGLLRHLFPNRRDIEYTLVTALYAWAPLFVSHAIFLNLDYGATALFVLFLHFLAADRVWHATAFAVALTFTKETGLAASAVTTVAFLVAFVLRPGAPWPQRAVALRAYAPLLVVPMVLTGYFLFAAVFRHKAISYGPVQLIANQADVIWNTNLADPSMVSFLADLFVLNYQWLYSAVIAVALCAACIRVEPHADEPGDNVTRRGLFLALALAGLVYIVTRFRFSNGARYVLLATPVLILAFYHALLSVCARHRRRLIYLSLCALLVFLSNFRTIDVVSRSFFGTLPFGSHALLDMTSRSGGLNLDSIVYNLEFLQLEYLYGDMIRDVRPRPGSVLLMGNAVYNFPPGVDGRDYSLTANPSRAIPFFVAIGDASRETIASHVTRDGELFFYMAFANADNVQIHGLLKNYPLAGKTTYERHGYTMDLYTFRFPIGS
jgi:hypothetical protein